jgi:predicted nucleic acid-binding protein
MKFGLTEAAPSEAWLAAALELTRTHEVPFYDAAYHALAITRKGVFVTADVRYVNRMVGEGTVVALSEWKAPVAPSSSRR